MKNRVLPYFNFHSEAYDSFLMPKASNVEAAQQDRCPLHVLLVEDHPTLAGCLCRHLEAKHHHVVRVADIKTAEAELAEQPFDLLITDMNLKDGDGEELLKRGNRIPPFVITMSAFDTVPRGTLPGVKPRHLVKPFPAEDLDALLKEFEQEFSRSLAADSTERQTGLPEIVSTVLRESARRRQCGDLTREQFYQKVARLTLEELHSRGLELLVRELASGTVRFLIKTKKTGAICEMIDCPPQGGGA